MDKFVSLYGRLVAALEASVLGLCGVLMVVMCVCVVLEVASRSLVEHSFVWTAELATVCFIWVGFLGATVGVLRNEHFVVDLLYKWFPTGHPVSVALEVLSYLLIAFLGFIFVRYGIDFMVSGMRRQSFSLGVPHGYLMTVMPVSGVLFVLNAVNNLLRMGAGQGVAHE